MDGTDVIGVISANTGSIDLKKYPVMSKFISVPNKYNDSDISYVQ